VHRKGLHTENENLSTCSTKAKQEHQKKEREKNRLSMLFSPSYYIFSF